MTTTQELRFERKTCSRCGGSGQYSYCEMYGTTCFKCGGAGKMLTTRGAAAYAWLKAKRSISASEVTVGMRIKTCGLTLNVQSVEQETESTSASLVEGKWIAAPAYLSIRGTKYGVKVFPNNTVEVIPPQAERLAQLKAAIEYQETLTKAGKPRKQKETA